MPAEAEPALSNVAKSLRDNLSWKIRVEGYTDNIGSKASNQTLSEQRASSVVDWLATHDVDRSRLMAKGYGEARPIASNATAEGRAQNRRVELVRELGAINSSVTPRNVSWNISGSHNLF
jgi:OmpA-OmpF porin, OOP family